MHDDSALSAEVTAHAIRRAEDAAFSDDPFPHFTVFGLFPDDFYRELVATMPPNDDCLPIGAKTSANGDSSCRLRFGLHEESLTLLPEAARPLWRAARATLQDEGFRATVYRKLASGLALRFGCRPEDVVEKAPGHALPELYRETKGYRITPHPDTRKKVVTMQVSLAVDDSQEHLGTEFYRRSLSPSSWKSEPRGFETVKTVPFLPNAASAFVVLNTMRLKSWHGRTLLAEQQGVRNSILNIWYANASDIERGDETHLTQKAAA